MSQFDGKIPPKSSSGCHVNTRFPIHTYLFNWTVENFSRLPVPGITKSLHFYPFPEVKWRAELIKLCGGTMQLYFYKTAKEVVNVNHNTFISNIYGHMLRQDKRSYSYYSEGQGLFCALEFRLEDLQSPAKDTVIFKCFMEFQGKRESDIYHFRTRSALEVDNLEELSNDLKSAYTNSKDADATLLVNGRTMVAHKFILCSRSPVFHRMFQTAMKEGQKNEIIISDVELPVLRNLIAFLYTGTMAAMDFDSLCSLYYAADKYDVFSLKKTCSNLLLSKMKVDNACRLLVFADLHGDEAVKSAVLDFIKFHFEEVMQSEGWKDAVQNMTKLAAQVMGLQIKELKKESDSESDDNDSVVSYNVS